jgi:hypothetical protein
VFSDPNGGHIHFTHIRLKALPILQCASKDAGLVNGLAIYDKEGDVGRHGISLANINGFEGKLCQLGFNVAVY